MKVGTDGVLLGAWADVEQARRVLDIGTGTGLIALMAAQRSQAEVCGVEVDEEAAGQACENADASPWKDRIRIICKPVQAYADGAGFDVIVSNPPYFQEQTFCPDSQRNGARHTDGLSFEELLEAVSRLLTAEEFLCCIAGRGSRPFRRPCCRKAPLSVPPYPGTYQARCAVKTLAAGIQPLHLALQGRQSGGRAGASRLQSGVHPSDPDFYLAM